MVSYNKIILFVIVLPLFTASIAVGGLQTAYGGNAVVCLGAPPGTPCELDGNLCTIDACDGAGNCLPMITVTCAPGDDVCDAGDSCNPETGQCEPLPDLPLSTFCELDGDLCTVDHCDGAGSCVTFSAVICADGDGVCEAGAECIPATGLCEPLADPPGTPCELDGDLCTVDACDGAGSCVLLSTTTCQDGDGICEAGAECNPETGACEDLADPSSGTECSCSIGAGECDGTGICIGIVSIDVKPGSDPNSINPKNMGLVPVAILGSDTFDVLTVDYANIEFGPSGAMPVHIALEDVNDDGFTDLVLQFVQKETGIAKGDIGACISGDTLGGQPFLGCDAIKTPGK